MINFKSVAARLTRFRARKPLAIGPVTVGWSKMSDDETFTLSIQDHQGQEDGGKGAYYSLSIGPKEAVDMALFVARIMTRQGKDHEYDRRENDSVLRALADLIEKNGGNL